MIRALIKTTREYNKQIKELSKLMKTLKHKQMKPFNIDLKASDKASIKKAVKYLRKLGYTVKKRKNELKGNLNYLICREAWLNYMPTYDFEYNCNIWVKCGETLTLPRDWDKLIEYTKREEKPKYKNGSYYWVNDGGAWKPAQKGDNVWHFMHYAAREEDVREVGEEIKRNT